MSHSSAAVSSSWSRTARLSDTGASNIRAVLPRVDNVRSFSLAMRTEVGVPRRIRFVSRFIRFVLNGLPLLRADKTPVRRVGLDLGTRGDS